MDSNLILVDGGTFVSSKPSGDVEASGHGGFYFEDVRHLTAWRLLLDGREPEILTSHRSDYHAARIVGRPPGEDPTTLTVRRDRFVSDGFHEDVAVTNLGAKPRRVRLELRFEADFADVMEVQGQDVGVGCRMWTDLGQRRVAIHSDRDGYRRGTTITFSRRPRLTSKRAVFELRLRPREEWKTCVDVAPVVEGRRRPPLVGCESFAEPSPKMPLSLGEWLARSPRLESDDQGLLETYRQSLLDLAALRLRPTEGLRWSMPGGGLPWYMTVFGRDSLITSYEALPFHAELARTTLTALAELQATEFDHYRDAEPGKIPHELRRGVLAALGKIPHRPYYGTHDATLLWLIVLDEYERWSADAAFVRRLEPAARAAIAWLEGPADLDGDGYVEYRRRSDGPGALDNQGWKDSRDAIRFADGSLAEPPIATCELQGYAYDARLRSARLARLVWGDEDLAARLERDAEELRQRFDRDFWLPRRRCYALALDGSKRPVDSVTSNAGQLLWSGIVPPRRARTLVRRLLAPDLFTGWGVRSMSAEDGGYNPLVYHCGTVWPHDTAIVAEGMRRYGFRAEASRLAAALLEAAAAFSHQLPEVFGGFERDGAEAPAEYPGALKPQAWAAAAPLLALRTLLGLDVEGSRLRSDPHPAPPPARLRLRGLTVRGREADAPGPKGRNTA
jgi:glycogen debranching enzyme